MRLCAVALLLAVGSFSYGCARARIVSPSWAHASMTDCGFQPSPDLRLHCRADGVGDAAFILIHGFGTSLETWHDIRPTLAQHGRVYALDLKGFGLSSKPDDQSYSPSDQASLVAQFIRFQKIEKPILIGHSYGGGVAVLAHEQLLSAGHPGARALVLIDAALYEQDLPFFVSNLRRPVINSLILNLTTASFRTRYTLKRVFRNHNAITEDRVDRYARFLDLPGAHRAFKRAAKQIDRIDFSQLERTVAGITVPTLVLWGADDPVISSANAHRLHKTIPGSRLELIPASGHVPHEEYPAPTADAIVRFVRELQ